MREEVTHWWEQSVEDFDSAEKNLKIKKYYLVAFLSQQALEKGMKAVMLKNRMPVQTMHSLPKLAEKIKVPQKFRLFLRGVSSEYYMSRYPDASEDTPFKQYTKVDAQEILGQTKEVMKWLTTQMK
ncbi:MAG: HEPN domain-containing protein [Patescibacteria group bacterium]|jgi:HEPN domain-containing protein